MLRTSRVGCADPEWQVLIVRWTWLTSLLCSCQLLYGGTCDAVVLSSDAADIVEEGGLSDAGEGAPLLLCNLEMRFDPPAPLTELNNIGTNDTVPVLTADELTIYFLRDEDIWWASRTSRADPFESPVILNELYDPNSATNGLAITPDGLTLFLSRLRYTNTQSAARNIWVTHRASRNLPFDPISIAGASTKDYEFEIAVGPNSQDLYITMQEAGPPFNIEMNLLVSDFRNGQFRPPRSFFNVNDYTMSEHAPAISFDERALYYARRRYADSGSADGDAMSPDGSTKAPNARTSDIYLSTRGA